MDAALVPVVLSPLTLSALLDYVLSTQTSWTSTLLIICSSRETFLSALSRSLDDHHGGDIERVQQLISPTLHNLATARHVHVAFCASVQALLAYLTAYGPTQHGRDARKERGRIVLVNSIALHAPTSAFSAQGLSRSFAAAVDAALRTNAQLLAVECPQSASLRPGHDISPVDEADADMDGDACRLSLERSRSKPLSVFVHPPEDQDLDHVLELIEAQANRWIICNAYVYVPHSSTKDGIARNLELPQLRSCHIEFEDYKQDHDQEVDELAFFRDVARPKVD